MATRSEQGSRPAERAPQPAAAEAAPRPGQSPAQTPPPTTTPPPQLSRDQVAAAIAAMPPTGQSTTPTVQMPQAAADQDLVEPEWVKAAEDAIEQTAGNPYAEEEAVEKLQVDYLKKRYGHEVKKPEGK